MEGSEEIRLVSKPDYYASSFTEAKGYQSLKRFPCREFKQEK